MLSSFLAAAAGAAAVIFLAPSPEVGAAPAPVARAPLAGASGSARSDEPDIELQMRVGKLEAELAAMRAQLGRLSSARVPMTADAASGEDTGQALLSIGSGDEAVLLEEVSKAMAKIDEQKAAAAREVEMERRKGEETKAYGEYEEVQANLKERVAKLSESMPMGSADRREVEGLMDLQVERMRDLTRDWASGDFTDEEVGERFMAERRQHRQAAVALLGQERIGAYKKFIQDGGLGGRYSFYLAPWESWAED